MFSYVLSPGVELRPVEHRHAPAIWDRVEHDRMHLREWLQWVDHSKSIADIEAWIEASGKAHLAGEGMVAGIWAGNEFAGVVGAHALVPINRKVEMGYWLGAGFVGRGWMTGALRALVTYAFDAWEVNRIEVKCAVGNDRSAAIPRRLGFVEEGVMREAQCLNGHFVDIRLFSMLARDWNR